MSLSAYNFNPGLASTDFVIGEDNFGDLSIHPMPQADCYWFKNSKKSLVKRFVLKRTPLTEKSCVVTLAKNDEGTYSPRFDFAIYDVTKKSFAEYSSGEVDVSKIKVKAKVDISDCRKEFNELLSYMMGLDDVELNKTDYTPVATSDLVTLQNSLKNVTKDEAVTKLHEQFKGKFSEKDAELLLDRKAKLKVFHSLLNDPKFFEAYRAKLGENKGKEAVWQHFFEHNQWIFGYGLKLVSVEALDGEKLERITTGANVFTGAGKRADGLLRTRGYISSLLFCEIKTDQTPLLAAKQYREPDVYRVSDELSGGVSQVQKTAQKALRGIASEFHRLYEPDGTPLRIEISTIRPRQVLLIGNLSQLTEQGDVNLEKSLSFELYRKSLTDVEIITFDELYERAVFIVGSED